MMIDIVLQDGPLDTLQEPQGWPAGGGAVLLFEGVVRLIENDRPLHALDYQVYEPMTSRELRRLAMQMLQRHGLLAMHVAHSYGIVPVGAVSFRLRIASLHRKEGIAAMDEFIDTMKRDVPIWKMPIWNDAQVKA